MLRMKFSFFFIALHCIFFVKNISSLDYPHSCKGSLSIVGHPKECNSFVRNKKLIRRRPLVTHSSIHTYQHEVSSTLPNTDILSSFTDLSARNAKNFVIKTTHPSTEKTSLNTFTSQPSDFLQKDRRRLKRHSHETLENLYHSPSEEALYSTSPERSQHSTEGDILPSIEKSAQPAASSPYDNSSNHARTEDSTAKLPSKIQEGSDASRDTSSEHPSGTTADSISSNDSSNEKDSVQNEEKKTEEHYSSGDIHSSEAVRDDVLEKKERDLADRSFKLAKEATCIDNHIQDLLDSAKKAKNKDEEGFTDPLTEESLNREQREIDEMHQKLAESKAVEEAVHMNDHDLPDAEETPTYDEMSKREQHHKQKLQEKESELQKKEKDIDCNTREALKEFTLETDGTDSILAHDPRSRLQSLHEKETMVSSEADLAKIEADAAFRDEQDTEHLVSELEDDVHEIDNEMEKAKSLTPEGDRENIKDVDCSQLDTLTQRIDKGELQVETLSTKLNRLKQKLLEAEELDKETSGLLHKAEDVEKNAQNDPCERNHELVRTIADNEDDVAKKASLNTGNLKKLRNEIDNAVKELDTTRSNLQREKADHLNLETKCKTEVHDSETSNKISDTCPAPQDKAGESSSTSISAPSIDRETAEAEENYAICAGCTVVGVVLYGNIRNISVVVKINYNLVDLPVAVVTIDRGAKPIIEKRKGGSILVIKKASMETSHTVNEPLDLIRLNLGDSIFVKCRGDRTLTGKLHAYDPHLNMILGDVEEILTCTVANMETGEKQRFKSIRQLPIVFVRGDAVMVISSQLQKSAV